MRTALLGTLAVVACACVADPGAHRSDVVANEGRHESAPEGDERPELAFLADVSHAGNFVAPDQGTFRVFELYEDQRIEVAVALQDGDVERVWNLSDVIGVGVDEIESIHRVHEDVLDIWVYEDDGGWAVYHVELDSRAHALSLFRDVYADYVEPDGDTQPLAIEKYAVKPSDEARYGALPRLRDLHVINFDHPTLGHARILELTEGDPARELARVLVGLRIGQMDMNIYDTGGVVRDVGAAFEIEPGYFDMQTLPRCEIGSADCDVTWDAIGIGFELSDDGRQLDNPVITVDLKYGVG
jgi:hypothetical protein